uniref:Transmembrane protein n=1 Tax=Haptolina brevifila TaxID=156173 RepID=A0A7S2I766_9EUKA
MSAAIAQACRDATQVVIDGASESHVLPAALAESAVFTAWGCVMTAVADDDRPAIESFHNAVRSAVHNARMSAGSAYEVVHAADNAVTSSPRKYSTAQLGLMALFGLFVLVLAGACAGSIRRCRSTKHPSGPDTPTDMDEEDAVEERQGKKTDKGKKAGSKAGKFSKIGKEMDAVELD